jgi:hypothetical protein
MKFEQIFSLRCHTEQAESQEARRKLYTNDLACRFSSLLDTNATILRIALSPNRYAAAEATILRIAQVVEPDGIEPTTSCLQSRRSPS